MRTETTEGQDRDGNVVLNGCLHHAGGGANRRDAQANRSAKMFHKSLLEKVDQVKRGGPRGRYQTCWHGFGPTWGDGGGPPTTPSAPGLLLELRWVLAAGPGAQSHISSGISWGLRIPGTDIWILCFSSCAWRSDASLSSRNRSDVSSPANS